MMGVINITPDSFSDGGKFLGSNEVLNQLKFLKSQGVHTFDFGAESTAPFNKSISSEQEWKRLGPIIEAVLNSDILDETLDTISIDTYKFEIFKLAYESIRVKSSKIKILWNDVSGKLEDEVLDFLKSHDFKLILSHNLCIDRQSTSSHMDFVSEQIDLNKYFQFYKEKLVDHALLDKVLFDPCFGFSKSLDQNYELLSSMQEWLDPALHWVIGISRKSFLQNLSRSVEKSERIKDSEYIHSLLISRWMKDFSDASILVRLHDPAVFNSACLV